MKDLIGRPVRVVVHRARGTKETHDFVVSEHNADMDLGALLHLEPGDRLDVEDPELAGNSFGLRIDDLAAD